MCNGCYVYKLNESYCNYLAKCIRTREPTGCDAAADRHAENARKHPLEFCEILVNAAKYPQNYEYIIHPNR